MKSSRQRAEERRARKLEEVQAQVSSGSLTIRKMTAEERKRYPPRPPSQKQRRAR